MPPDELEVVKVWDVTSVDVVGPVTTEDSVVALEVCIVGLSAELMVTEEVTGGGSVEEVTTTMVEVGISCEVGMVSEVIGAEGADSVEGVDATLSVSGVVGATVELSICRIKLVLGTTPANALGPSEIRLTIVTNSIAHNTNRRISN